MASLRTIDFRYAPPIVFTSICRPDDPNKSLVREDGSLLYGFTAVNFESWYFQRVLEFRMRSARGPQAIHQVTESARVPVVITTVDYSRATLTLRAFGHQDAQGRRTDVVLWEIAAHDNVDQFLAMFKVDVYEQAKQFSSRTGSAAHVIYALPFDQPVERPRLPSLESVRLEADNGHNGPGPVAFVSSPQPLMPAHAEGFRPCSALAIEPVLLKGGERVEGAILVPVNHADVVQLDLAWAKAALEEERIFWNKLALPALPIEVPDPALMEMVTACARNILQAREIKEGFPEFQVGPTIYRGLWVVDGHFLLEAAQYLGYREEAFAGLNALLRRVRPDGEITQMEFHTKETAVSLATLVRQCELMGRDDRLLELWPAIQAAVAWIESQRAAARALPRDAPNYGLFPDSFADGGIGGKRAEYTTALWTLAGLKAIVGAAWRLNKHTDAGCWQQMYDSLMADFRRCYTRDVHTLPDGTTYLPQWMASNGDHHWIPNYPYSLERHNQLQPQSGIWALNQTIYPGEVFGPTDPIVVNHCRLLEQIDGPEGIPSETGWLPYKANWNYDAAFCGQVMLYAGRPDKAVDYLYAFANHASPTRVWREEHSFTNSDQAQFCGDMPHNWASAEFVRLVRHLLVFERGETLELLPGLPPQWIFPGAVTRLVDTPTRFGPVSVTVSALDDKLFAVDVEFDLQWPRRPAAVKLWLPAGATATIDGQPSAVPDSGWLELPWATALTVVGTFA